jgi:hypothetical protein
MRARKQLTAFVLSWLHCAATRLLRFSPACLAAVVVAALSWNSSVASDVPISLRLVWGFSHAGIARFCYDKTPAVIYPKYDVVRKMTSILKRELDGQERVVGEFPGSPDPRSLSCSQDGQTIVALGGDHRESLFIAKGTQTSVYLIPHFWVFSNVGLYSLIRVTDPAAGVP